jgi:hypothetical protein
MAAGLEGVRACLIVSGDGLSLGAYPDHAEPMARSVWERLSAVGDAQRGFFSVGDELWVVARRGWYAALLIASPTVKPGLVLDRLESYLRTAEESRIRESAELTAPPGTGEAPRRLRTPLHRERPEPRPTSPPLPATEVAPPPRREIEPTAPANPTAAVFAQPDPPPPPVVAEPPVNPPVSPPAPEPPPVARPEPEIAAPRPPPAAAGADPPMEA